VDREYRRDYCLSILQQEGYPSQVDSDGDISFTYEGGSYYAMISPDDDRYFAIQYPNFWSIDSDTERLAVLMAAERATRSTKVAKVFLDQDRGDTMAAAEIFLEDWSRLSALSIGRCISSIRSAVATFQRELRILL
jgi:hypothetical protein